MCGIVAAAARREVSEILLEGLRRLEYRGYDSAGMSLIDSKQHLQVMNQAVVGMLHFISKPAS